MELVDSIQEYLRAHAPELEGIGATIEKFDKAQAKAQTSRANNNGEKAKPNKRGAKADKTLTPPSPPPSPPPPTPNSMSAAAGRRSRRSTRLTKRAQAQTQRHDTQNEYQTSSGDNAAVGVAPTDAVATNSVVSNDGDKRPLDVGWSNKESCGAAIAIQNILASGAAGAATPSVGAEIQRDIHVKTPFGVGSLLDDRQCENGAVTVQLSQGAVCFLRPTLQVVAAGISTLTNFPAENVSDECEQHTGTPMPSIRRATIDDQDSTKLFDSAFGVGSLVHDANARTDGMVAVELDGGVRAYVRSTFPIVPIRPTRDVSMPVGEVLARCQNFFTPNTRAQITPRSRRSLRGVKRVNYKVDAMFPLDGAFGVWACHFF